MKQITPNPSILRRLQAIYHSADPLTRQAGHNWYQDAHRIASELAAKHNAPESHAKHAVTLVQVVGVIAAISPGCSWERNVEYADQILRAFTLGRSVPKVGTYGQKNVDKCKRILAGETPLDVLGGRKVRAFYANILNPACEAEVTIDRHAIGAARNLRGDSAAIVTDWQVKYIACQYKTLATRLGVLPHQAQATVWLQWRAGQEIPF